MRTLAKVSLLVFFPAAALTAAMPAFVLLLWPIVMFAGLPVAWYVIFTRPFELLDRQIELRTLS